MTLIYILEFDLIFTVNRHPLRYSQVPQYGMPMWTKLSLLMSHDSIGQYIAMTSPRSKGEIMGMSIPILVMHKIPRADRMTSIEIVQHCVKALVTCSHRGECQMLY